MTSPRLLELEDKFKKNGGEIKHVKIKEIFTVSNTKRKFNANSIKFEGSKPYVARGSSNNGIRGYINAPSIYLNPPNTLSFGQDTATVFFQEEAYFTGDKIKILSVKSGNLNPRSGLYLVSCIRQAFKSFQWGTNSFSEEIILNSVISIPMFKGKVSIEFMEDYIRELEEDYIRELDTYLKVSGLENCELEKEELEMLDKVFSWGNFDLTFLFDISNTQSILKSQIFSSKTGIPYLTAKEGNNSVASYVAENSNLKKDKGNCVFIGGKTLVVSYQESDFYSNDSHNLTLHLKSKKDCLDEDIGLFLVGAIYKSLKPKYTWGNSISFKKIQKDSISLPVKADGSPDWKLMKTMIKAVKKLVIADVVKFKDEYIEKSKQAIK